jgi:hypothetical protein
MDQIKKQTIGDEPSPESLRQYGKGMAAAAERFAAMLEVLAGAGFAFTAKKDYIYADSEAVEAVDARRLLSDHGFADREYQIYLEYRRQWGVM